MISIKRNHIDTMTKKWLLQTPNPPRIPVFCTFTKIHKPTLPVWPIISGCDGPTERISSFLDHILQPIAQAQKSYLKNTTQFINFIEERKVKKKSDSSLNGWLPIVSFNPCVMLGNSKLFCKGNTMCVWNSRGRRKHHSLLSPGTGDFTRFHLHKKSMPRLSPNWGLRGFQMTGA